MSVHEFKLPDVGEGLSEGELIKWYVAVGDAVTVDQIICDVQTDKAIVELPSPVTGKVSALGGAPGDIIPVGAMLACFEVAGAPVNSEPLADAGSPVSDQAKTGGRVDAMSPDESNSGRRADLGGGVAAEATEPTGGGRRAKASPAIRKLARQMGIDLATVVPSGDRGQVTRADLEEAGQREANIQPAVPAGPTHAGSQGVSAAVSGAPPVATPPAELRPTGEDREEPLLGLRRQIAQTMQAAWQNIPHIYSLREIDATALVDAREVIGADLGAQGISLTFMPFFVKACVLALEANPRFNASLDMDGARIIYRHRINIGIATATPDGLVVTVVHDADRKSLADIAVEIDELARLGRERKATVAQLSHGTFTISNYGSQGAWMGTPIIRPPEVAIAGFGRIEDKVIPVDGQPAVCKVLPMSVATDHRLNDGEHLGHFMASLVSFLGQPVRMLARS